MPITIKEKEEIIKTALFLEERGYSVTMDEYSVNYSKDNICISIVYPPNSDESNVIIRFIEINQVFDIGWIALVRDGKNPKNVKIENIRDLLDYVKENYNEITNRDFCLESDNLIHEYVINHKKDYQDKVSEFLDKYC